jgi:pimeloyl-ACP methyl ester carboxylesterase
MLRRRHIHPVSAVTVGGGWSDPKVAMTTFHTATVEGLDVFYREAVDPANPKLLLIGGFPSSSHQFRDLIPALADRFHVLSPDYLGFGNTDLPDPSTWDYTFDHLAEVVDGLLTQVGFIAVEENVRTVAGD